MEVLYARWLLPDDYGEFVYTYNWASLFSVLVSVGLVTSLLKLIPKYLQENEYSKVKGLTVGSSLAVSLAGLCLFSALWFISLTLRFDRWHLVLLGVITAVPLGIVRVQSSVIRSVKKIFLAFLGRYVGWPGLSIMLMYFLTFIFDLNIFDDAIIVVVISLVIISILQIFLVRLALPESVWRHTISFSGWRKWLKISTPLLFVSGFQIVISKSDVVVVGTMLGSNEASLYNAGSRTARLLTFILSAFNSISAPMISEYWTKNDINSLESLMSYTVKMVFWPSLCVYIILSIFSEQILSIFGPRFTSVWPILIIVGLGQLFHALTGPVGYLLSLTDNENVSAEIFGISAIINVILSVAFVSAMGLIGAALATTISIVIQNILLVMMVSSRVGINMFTVWKKSFFFN